MANSIILNNKTFQYEKIYYVDSENGSDSNEGTSPFLQLKTLESAITKSQTGDIIFLTGIVSPINDITINKKISIIGNLYYPTSLDMSSKIINIHEEVSFYQLVIKNATRISNMTSVSYGIFYNCVFEQFIGLNNHGFSDNVDSKGFEFHNCSFLSTISATFESYNYNVSPVIKMDKCATVSNSFSFKVWSGRKPYIPNIFDASFNKQFNSSYKHSDNKTGVYSGAYCWITNKTLILSNSEYKKFTENLYINDLITMSSDSNDDFSVSANSVYDSTMEAWKAFDKNTKTLWETKSGVKNGWLKFASNNEYYYKIMSFSLTPSNAFTAPSIGEGRMPKEWTLEGSNDDVSWVKIQSYYNTSWTVGVPKTFTVNMPKFFKMYRLNITSITDSSDSYIAIGEVTFSGKKSNSIDNDSKWLTVSSTLPNQAEFETDGMDNLSTLFNRVVTELEPTEMTVKNDILNVGEMGKVFSQTINLKKNLDIRSVEVEVK